MSRVKSTTVDYSCSADCKQGECPGHKVTLVSNCSTDTVSVMVDGEERFLMDDNLFSAMNQCEFK